MPKVGSEHKQHRKNQIIQAAFECFGEKGVHQTSMRDICKQAELSTGAVYNYFDSKEEIIEALAEKSRNSTDFLFGDIQDSDSREKVLQKIVRNISNILTEQHKRGELKMKVRLWSEAQESERLHALFRQNFADIESKIISCLEEHSIKENQDNELSLEEIARIIVATYQGLVLQMVLREDVDPENSMGHLAYLLTNHS